jgi:hypothetical protein
MDPRHGVDRVFDEVNQAIAEEGIGPAWMPAPRARERAPFRGLVVALQASRRAAYAPEPERWLGIAGSAKLANPLRPTGRWPPPIWSVSLLRSPCELSTGRSALKRNSPARSPCGACRCGDVGRVAGIQFADSLASGLSRHAYHLLPTLPPSCSPSSAESTESAVGFENATVLTVNLRESRAEPAAAREPVSPEPTCQMRHSERLFRTWQTYWPSRSINCWKFAALSQSKPAVVDALGPRILRGFLFAEVR